MTPEDLAGVLIDVRRLRAGFTGTAPRSWTATTAAAEMTVQLGHLALCLLRRWAAGAAATDLEDPRRPITDIGDELADVLLALLSVPTLADTEPAGLLTPRPAGRSGGEVARFLRPARARPSLARLNRFPDWSCGSLVIRPAAGAM